MKMTPLGDSALLVRFGEKVDAAQTLRDALAAKKAIERARIPGVIECASAYTTVAVFFDTTEAIAQGAETGAVTDWFAERVRAAIESTGRARARVPSRKLDIPICCEDEFALDLSEVAAASGLPRPEVVRLFCATDFRVGFIGFTPGFPYLAGLPGRLATPRRPMPRAHLPAGSVAIGGAQAGIYPTRSPGGWNVIGRTPLQLFTPEQNPPSLLLAGDGVRFKAITRFEFDELHHESALREGSCI